MNTTHVDTTDPYTVVAHLAQMPPLLVPIPRTAEENADEGTASAGMAFLPVTTPAEVDGVIALTLDRLNANYAAALAELRQEEAASCNDDAEMASDIRAQAAALQGHQNATTSMVSNVVRDVLHRAIAREQLVAERLAAAFNAGVNAAFSDPFHQDRVMQMYEHTLAEAYCRGYADAMMLPQDTIKRN